MEWREGSRQEQRVDDWVFSINSGCSAGLARESGLTLVLKLSSVTYGTVICRFHCRSRLKKANFPNCHFFPCTFVCRFQVLNLTRQRCVVLSGWMNLRRRLYYRIKSATQRALFQDPVWASEWTGTNEALRWLNATHKKSLTAEKEETVWWSS